jgi:ribosomal protein S18 acetylase RimI-like enzyme
LARNPRRRGGIPDPPGRIRRLWAFERAKVHDHLLRLDGDDRLLRFGGYASAAQITAYCEQLDWSRALIVGYVEGGEVRGLGELKPIGDGWPRAAELAVSVERPYQNRGIGSALLRRLVVFARNRLLDRLYMICLIDNGKALRMARRLDGALRFDHGEAEARIEPPWPTPWTWLEETLEFALPGTMAEPSKAARERHPSADQVITEGARRPVRSPIPAS